ncbi:hypothetical protein [Pandoraea cepalis]|uniref:hypothetical protein n=1 Tax=Pandoraea cepalis TaxID=2508294 RepID=UPI0015820F6B|nr:hypothetical protein [Pandoraea cepalis]
MPKTNLEIVQPPKRAPRDAALNDQDAIDRSRTAEIVLALCGPMGTPLHDVAKTFKDLLEGTDLNHTGFGGGSNS